ncbi:MAG: caffeoyl-CoA O-methyltransferase [Solirubrobacteraceae bacterium]|jgi:caffeoyl-CoA O-methyltransferase|nr:caffeoyl-CoA O-methyltransferase [Solirubrobacteraceae bacterium]
MDLVNPAIEAYADGHVTPPPDYLARLDAEARAVLPFPAMLSGPVVGRLLEALVALRGAEEVLEIGTYAGSSALWMARGLAPGGRVVTCELDPDHAAFARRHIAASPHADQVEVRVGPALETVAELPGPFDFVFIDADKTGYPAYLDAVLPKLAPGALVIADNVLRAGRVLEEASEDPGTRAIKAFNTRVANDPALAATLLTVRDGLLLIRRA